MPKKTADNTCTNFYNKLPAHLKKRAPNPDFDQHGLDLPFRAIIVGASGSGKTSLVFEFLKRAPRTFSKVVLICRSADEPLYRWLKETADPDTLKIFEYDIDGIPPLDDLKGEVGNVLVIFDDLVSLDSRRLQPVVDYYIRARKVGQHGASLMFLTQSYYRVPKTIRVNCNLIFVKKLASTRDLNMILNDCSLGVTKEQLYNIYKAATRDKFDFLLIDLDRSEGDGKFRRNFLECLA